MKLLIITQVVDTRHSVLGFFHGWILEFAKQCEHVHVICLYEGEHNFPNNVSVHSLGKENGTSRFKYLYRFFNLIWKLRYEYDGVFVHMNQIYVVLGGVYWRLMGKKVGLWYAHPHVGVTLRVAAIFTNLVFTGSTSSFRIPTPKVNVLGQGIDFELFKYKDSLNLTSPKVIVVGRISMIKNIELAIDTLPLIRKFTDATLHVVGGPLNDIDSAYFLTLKEKVRTMGLGSWVVWHGPLPAIQMQEYLYDADIFLHTSLTHSADKTLPEAMSSGLFVVSSNQAYEADLPEICFKPPKADEYARAIQNFISLSAAEREELRMKFRLTVKEKHSLGRLVERILEKY
jgi:glycosyltransferase involved in cell wall biosynthesis